jgi:hypothetical protein
MNTRIARINFLTAVLCVVSTLFILGCKSSSIVSIQGTPLNPDDWCPPYYVSGTNEMQQILDRMTPKSRFSSKILTLDVAGLMMVEIRDTAVDNTPANIIVIYYRQNLSKSYHRCLLIPTKNYYPSDLRPLGQNRFELIEVKDRGEVKSLGVIFDPSRFPQ